MELDRTTEPTKQEDLKMARARITIEIETEDVDMAFETITDHVEIWHEILDAKMEKMDDDGNVTEEVGLDMI